jgi:restriction system protein
MGGLSMNGRTFWEILSEGVGFKTGLTLDREDLLSLFNTDDRFADLADLPADEAHGRRFESVEYEELFFFLLFKLGRLERERRPSPMADLHHKYKNDPIRSNFVNGVGELFLEFSNSIDLGKVGAVIDPRRFISLVVERYGADALEMAMQLLGSVNASVIGSPWSRAREVTWDNDVALRELFRSEGLVAPVGPFVDQRYIDFLHRNFDRIDEVNWRKFEGLTGDFFQREGYRVELGPGRNDGGVDLRVWTDSATSNNPPTILVQCKREKAPVGRVVMKALYADVLHEGATSGLIVTSSRLSPGARDDRNARGYPIADADRATVREWIRKLRRPGAGYVG